MEHLTIQTIEKFVRGEYPYQRLLEISAHLVTCPNNCKQMLHQTHPDFLAEAENLENARTQALAQENHFSEAEIESYVLKTFGIEKRQEMNRHFTKCRRCSQGLKEKDPDYLSNFIKDKLNRNSEPEIVVTGEEKGLFFRVLVPAAAFSLLIILSLAIIFMLPFGKNNDQAKLEEISAPPIANNMGSNGENNKNTKITDDINKKTNTNTQLNNQNVGSKSNLSSKPVGLPSPQKPSNQTKNNKSQNIIVQTRSFNKNCESNPNLAITPKDEVITDIQPNLSWKPYPNAVSYKIYLSDTANNLVEESDIAKGEITSYKLTNKLELNKKYEWKVVTTLKDGKEIYSKSANFSVGEKAKKIVKTKRNSIVNETRCSKTNDFAN